MQAPPRQARFPAQPRAETEAFFPSPSRPRAVRETELRRTWTGTWQRRKDRFSQRQCPLVKLRIPRRHLGDDVAGRRQTAVNGGQTLTVKLRGLVVALGVGVNKIADDHRVFSRFSQRRSTRRRTGSPVQSSCQFFSAGNMAFCSSAVALSTRNVPSLSAVSRQDSIFLLHSMVSKPSPSRSATCRRMRARSSSSVGIIVAT